MKRPIRRDAGVKAVGQRALAGARIAVLVSLACFVLAACEGAAPGRSSDALRFDSPVESHNLAARGIAALQDDDPDLASQFFNAALKLDIQNSYLQLLNGLAYHTRASRSDSTQFSLAEQGYRLAVQFDANNWLARYFLGRLYLDQKRFAAAQSSLAEAMLYADSDPDLLYYFAVASYYARDPESAAGALVRLRELDPESPRTMQASSIVSAAIGNRDEARRWASRFAEIEKGPAATFVARRVSDWSRVYDRAGKSSDNTDASLATLRAPSLGGGDAPLFDKRLTAAEALAREAVLTRPLEDDPGDSEESSSGEDDEESETDDDGEASAAKKSMVIVDVVIISSVEDISTAKGVNLLNGLQIQFGAPEIPAFSLSRNIVRDSVGDLTADPVTFATAEKTTIVRALTIPTITYSLNIANAGSNRNEILARPSLVAEEGQRSEFFSGENIKASAVSKTSQEGETSVDQDVGVKLAITPESVEDDRVRMQIEVERTFLQAPSSSVQFDFQIRVSKTLVTANVALRRGETLILSGLSEKETESTRDGVPGLQELPGLQYLFSRQTTRDFNRSVLVLVTPREPEYTFRPQAEGGAAESDPGEALDELKARYTDWFQPYPNWASVFHHLQNNQLYREFRTGDVALERWDSQENRGARLHSIMDFLYY